MLDVKKIRKDFPMLDNKIMQGHPLVYFDSAATSLKPKQVIESMNDYYFNYNSNVHRGDYDIAAKTDSVYENAREVIAKFINAESKELIFTSGTTQSINLVAFGYALKHLTHQGRGCRYLRYRRPRVEDGSLRPYARGSRPRGHR